MLENSDGQESGKQAALSNCYYLLNLSNDLLDLAQMKVGKFKLSKRAFDLRKQLASCLDLFSLLAERKGVKLQLEWQGASRTIVSSDENRLRQVVVNLLGNAFKFTL
jgi:signal transduction histidine kinase